MNRFATSSLALALTASTGCGMIKNLEEMHDATVSMSGTTTGMAETTDHMADTTDNLNATAGSTYADLRQGNSLTIRTERLRAMEHAQAMAAKISEAAKFEMAFEFQLWKAFDADTEAKRQMLYEDAIPEFFRSIADYVPHNRPTDPTSNDDDMKNLYALAVTMHRVNPNQIAMAAEQGIDEVCILGLVKDGLRAKAAIESGEVGEEELPAYQVEVLKEEQNAVYMLKLRHQFLAAMAMSKVSDTESRGNISAFFRKLRILLFKWDADFSGLNEVQIREYAKWLRESDDTRDFLAEIGVESKLNKKLRKILGKMRIRLSEDASTWTGKDRAIDEYRQAVARVLE
ncbi:MAG: hypothetical protein IT285_12145 [Bdellovibrionales bacterium]|nr:hypothetical protein [Bdellovibrionales bacterium]